jgi:hypothetical protein
MEDKANTIRYALSQFPELSKVIGEKRILDIAQEDPRNLLIAYLEKTVIEEKRKK